MPPKVSLSWKSEVKNGSYQRSASVFRNFISAKPSPDTKFVAEKGRYALYVSMACPWACRTLMVVKLKGLEDVITPVSIVHTHLGENGWRFPTDEDPCEGSTQDLIFGKRYLREIYAMSNPDGSNEWTGKVTVPVLFDTKTKTIVNNESAEIIEMLNSEFNEFAKYPDIDLYPEHLREKIDEINAWVYDNINNGVYKNGFATTQKAYEEANQKLFAYLDKAEEILSKNRYLAGSEFTLADVRLFTTLVRFEPVYYRHFRCCKKSLRMDYPNLWNYHLEIAQMPAVRPTINLDHCIKHYFGSHKSLNPSGIIPIGPNINLDEKHDRAKLESKSAWTTHESSDKL